MFEIFGVSVVLVAVIVLTFFAITLRTKPEVKVMAIQGDEDIKIAESSFKKPLTGGVDSAEEAAEEFLSQKKSGNIELSDALGSLLAERLCKEAQELIMNEGDLLSTKAVHQRIILMGYAAINLIGDFAPTRLLAETGISVFYNKIETMSDILYKHINDTSSFSFYILNYRDPAQTQDVGEIYARLCEKQGDLETIKEGNQLFKGFYDQYKEIAEQNISFKI